MPLLVVKAATAAANAAKGESFFSQTRTTTMSASITYPLQRAGASYNNELLMSAKSSKGMSLRRMDGNPETDLCSCKRRTFYHLHITHSITFFVT